MVVGEHLCPRGSYKIWQIFNLPCTKSCPPCRKPITVVVGAPIAVEKNPSPSEELVASIHEQYTCALQQLFDGHKAKFGAADATLNILEAHSHHKKQQ